MSVINAKMNDSRKENFLGLFFVSDWFFLGVFRCSFVLLGFFFNESTYKFVTGGNGSLFMQIRANRNRTKIRKILNTGRRGET